MEILVKDIRYALRSMIKTPWVTFVAVLMIALGIGANTALFSVVNAILLRTLPLGDPSRLVVVWETNPKMNVGPRGGSEVALANLLDWETQSEAFEGFAAFRYSNYNLTDVTEPQRLQAVLITANFHSVVGVQPALGRTFEPKEQVYGQHRVTILSYAMWKRDFGSDPNILQRQISLNSTPYTVIGVMPENFNLQFPSTMQVDLWIPLVIFPEKRADRSTHFLYVLSRLKPGVSLQRAQSEMDSVASRLATQYPDTNADRGIKLVSLREFLVGDTRPAILVLMGSVIFLLLIACANVANLLLARATVMQKEIAVRVAIGATRGHLIRQFLTESVLLSLIGGVFGLLLAYGAVKIIVDFSPANIPRIKETVIDTSVLGFTLLITLMTGMIFGIAPAFQSLKININELLKQEGRGISMSSISGQLRQMLIVLQVALSLVLLIASGLMIRSLTHILKVDPGFNPNNLLTLQVTPAGPKYADASQVLNLYQQLIERVRALPGVQIAGATSMLPLSGANLTNGFTIEGRPLYNNQQYEADYRIITQGYFEGLGTPILTGRDFSDSDQASATPVVIINETLARRYFPNESPIGKRITITDGRSDLREIVGVIKDIKHLDLKAESRPEIYVAFTQNPYLFMTLVMRGHINPQNLVPAIRREVAALDKDLPIYDIKSMDERLIISVAPERFNMILLSIMGGLALILAAVGLYGLMAYLVVQRTQEIGIRMALGALPGSIIKLVVGQGLRLTLVGLGLGLIGALILTKFMASLLYGVGVYDPVTFLVLSLLLAATALIACYVPARRAARIDPIVALRGE